MFVLTRSDTTKGMYFMTKETTDGLNNELKNNIRVFRKQVVIFSKLSSS